MTSAPRDPAFWQRFATAVQEDEKRQASVSEIEKDSSWLDREAQKRRRARRVVIAGAVAMLLFVTVIVLACVYLSAHGWYMHGEQFTVP